jgi:hypothetical protein
MNIDKYIDEKYYMKLFTKGMIVLIFLRIVSIFILVMRLEIKAGYWGLYQLPFIYPIYVVILLLDVIYLVRKEVQHLTIYPLHIFTFVYMTFDLTIYILSIGKPWDYWPF